MRIAVIGGGISGLTAAYELAPRHRVTLFEANGYVGGHTNTIDVTERGSTLPIDTGFIVFNNRTYPRFERLLDAWGVESQPTTMSFSVQCERTRLEYRGIDLNGLFAQRSNLFSPRFYRLLGDFYRFNRAATELLAHDAESTETVGAFLARHRLSQQFCELYLLPMGSAVWSCPRDTFADFPIRFIAEFFHNHGLLSTFDRPTWRVIRGGSKTYVRAALARFSAQFRGEVRTQSPVVRVERTADAVFVTPANGEREAFDHAIFACHSDQALRILGADATATEREILGGFPYEENIATLHTDTSVLPRSRRAWACWNAFVPRADSGKATVTYWMNELQSLRADEHYLVTLNDNGRINPAKVLKTIIYHHPIFTVRRAELQRRHHELINVRRTSFCGAYWRNGFHEDGVVSAEAVVAALSGSETDAKLPVRGARVPSAIGAD